MKDFAARNTRSSRKTTHSKSTAVAPNKKLILVLVVLGVLLLGFVGLRSLRWVDFLGANGQDMVLLFARGVDQQGAYITRFDFNELVIDVYPIEPDVPVEVMGGYGQYRFQAVYPLLELEGNSLPYIRSTLSLSLGVLFDEIWPVDTAELMITSQRQLQAFLLGNLWQGRQVPLTSKLAWLGLAFDNRTEFVVHQPLAALPAETLQLPYISQEELSCTVALINTTSLNGLAGRIETLLEAHNFRVVRTTSDDTPVTRTQVIVGEELSPDCVPVAEKIRSLVPGGVEEQTDTQQTVRNRADLVVKLGVDLIERPED